MAADMHGGMAGADLLRGGAVACIVLVKSAVNYANTKSRILQAENKSLTLHLCLDQMQHPPLCSTVVY